MGRMVICCMVGCLAVLMPPRTACAQERSDDAARLESLTAEVERLRAEITTLRAENAALKERLAAATATTRPASSRVAATRPATTRPADAVATKYELGEWATLGNYQIRAPRGWAVAPKDDRLQALFRAPDKASVVLVRVKPRGGAPMEVQAKYAQNIIQMLKQDFVKNMTEVIDPPVQVPDPRFYLRVRERIRIKGEKTADQTHFYIMPGKDMVELTVITTSDNPDVIAATQRLAEEMLLSLKPIR